MVVAAPMLLPLLVCLIYREDPVPFLLAIAITLARGPRLRPDPQPATTSSPGRASSPWR